MRGSKYLTLWKSCVTALKSAVRSKAAWNMRGLKQYNSKPLDSASNRKFLMQLYFEPHLFLAVMYFEPQLSHAFTYFKPRISHATPFWLQNHANWRGVPLNISFCL